MLQRDPSQQELFLRQRLRGDVYRRSTFHRGRLDRAGLRHGFRYIWDLRRLPVMRVDDVETAGALLLASPEMGAPIAPKIARGAAHLKAMAERKRYWPARWSLTGSLPLAYSTEDSEALGLLGKELLEAAGISAADVLLSVLASPSGRDRWQLEQGALRMGASFVALAPGSSAPRLLQLDPTVMIGSVDELRRIFEEGDESSGNRIHTVLVVGVASGAELQSLRGLLDAKVAMLRAWAPDGVMALWGQCRGGIGFHISPAYEVAEVVDPLTHLPKLAPFTTEAGPDQQAITEPGLVLWTGIGWFATALVRLDTDTAASMISGRCPTCGRTSPRLVPAEAESSFADTLDSMEAVSSWAAELHRKDGKDVLMLYVALVDVSSSLVVLATIDSQIGSAVVQVVQEEEVSQRHSAVYGERFVDRRAASDFD